MPIRVECYAGHRGEETPRRFEIGDLRVDVVEVVDRWLEPDYRYFRVKGANGKIYLLRYNTTRDSWELTARGSSFY
jgi:hypothetical protein